MGNSCSGQGKKDDASLKSDRSPSYSTTKLPLPESGCAVKPTETLPSPAKKPQLKCPRPTVASSVSDSISLSSPITTTSPKELAPPGPPMPSSITELAEEQRSTLLGRFTARQRKRRNIVVYVATADYKEFAQDKEALHSELHRLRNKVRSKGWSLHVSDLHWTLPMEEEQDHRFSMLCTAEIAHQSEQAHLIPLIMFNSSLGAPLLPSTLEYADYQSMLISVTYEEKQLLERIYHLAQSDVTSCYRCSYEDVKKEDLNRILQVLVKALPLEARDAYLTTVVEQEVQQTVLMSADLAKRCIWLTSDKVEPSQSPIQEEMDRRSNALQLVLKHHLLERNIVRATESRFDRIDNIRKLLGDRLENIIDGITADCDQRAGYNGIPASLFEEIDEHLSFCQKSSQCTNREVTLSELKAYVTGDSSVPLALLGGTGCGKATLVARAATLATTWMNDLALVIRFVGLTSQSSSSHSLLKSIVDQCHVLLKGIVFRGRNDVQTLSSVLPGLLAEIGRSRPILLAIVGTDQLRGARWLPSRLPNNAKMIVTVTEETDDPSSSAIMAVLSSDEGPNIVRASCVSADSTKSLIASIPHYESKQANDVIAAIEKKSTPLYAKILAWHMSLTVTYGEIETQIPISENLDAQIEQFFLTLESMFGYKRVSHCLALLAASRRGLSDPEMIDILSHSDLFRDDGVTMPWAPCTVFWAHLSWVLCWWFQNGRWLDNALDVRAKERYLADNEEQVRQTIVDYFQGDWYKECDSRMMTRMVSQDNAFSENVFNTRKLEELPYQHYHLLKKQSWELSYQPYFTDLQCIYAKLASTSTTDYLQDISFITEPTEHIILLKELLESYSHALDTDHRQFYSLLNETIENRTSTIENKNISSICKKWLEVSRNPPIPQLMVAGEGSLEKNNVCVDLIVKLGKNGRFVATLSTEGEEICVWDVVNCHRVRTLKGIPHPTNLVPIDETRCVVLCKRELRVYDLDKGEFLVCLKGVMNQKMPYFGLHDSKHLVALSRNRMYVNMMNLDTGDCVTTFKAGEDRFLNSLLVSGDGRTLVCGDETQKPFPLLVWSLASRKLLYDLRIQHHDFVTSKSAITYEGSYVCVVARELDEPSPNFIVVYDLQSGTLFKKWKPGCDTCCLAISSDDGCVLSGLADTRILMWDLVTGNCRLTLSGHTSAPSSLILASDCSVLLAMDDSGRDPTVRLWDLHTGKQIAVYTPKNKIKCCEVLAGGKYVTMAMENCTELVTLKLEGPLPNVIKNIIDVKNTFYGCKENNEKVYVLSEQ